MIMIIMLIEIKQIMMIILCHGLYSLVYLWKYVLQYIVRLQGQPAQREQRHDNDEHFYDLEKKKKI